MVLDFRWDFCLQQSLPLVISICYFAPVGLQWCLNKVGREKSTRPQAATPHGSQPTSNKPTIRARLNSSISKSLSVVNMLYLPISRYSTSVFQCVTLPDGSSVLKAFPDMLCYSQEHTVFRVLGCVGISLCTHASALILRAVCTRAWRIGALEASVCCRYGRLPRLGRRYALEDEPRRHAP